MIDDNPNLDMDALTSITPAQTTAINVIAQSMAGHIKCQDILTEIREVLWPSDYPGGHKDSDGWCETAKYIAKWMRENGWGPLL